jgi:hypothetical protein
MGFLYQEINLQIITSDNISSILPITSAAFQKDLTVPSSCAFVSNNP